MSSTSAHQPTGQSAGIGQRPTQEIPFVQPAPPAKPLPPHPQATPPLQAGPEPVGAPQPTGPVDFVPGLPGAGTPPPHGAPGPAYAAPAPGPVPAPAPAPAVDATGPSAPSWPDTLESELLDADRPKADRPKKERGPRTARSRAALTGLALAALTVVLLELGLALGFGTEPFWSTVTLWSAFATVAALLALVAFAAFYPAGNHLRAAGAWRVAAAGLVGLSVFWVLVVLPVVASDRGFVLTAALGCLGVALWIGPRRSS